MKERPLTLTERHPPGAAPSGAFIRRVVTAWLNRELRARKGV